MEQEIVTAKDIFMPFIEMIPEPIRWAGIALAIFGFITYIRKKK